MITYEEARKMIQKMNQVKYPQISNIMQNNTYANMLHDSFAGELGEFSAVSQYIFEHINYFDNDDFHKIIKDIAIMEMKHLELVGNVIKKLGKEPLFLNTKGDLWCASNVRYDFNNMCDMINYNIDAEKKAIEGYRKAQLYTRNRSLRNLFERIIMDENLHIEIFKKML